MEKIAVIGLGYVGLTLSGYLLNKGRDVLGFDVNERVINSLRSGRLPISENGLDSIIADKIHTHFICSTKFPTDFEGIVFITVSTPIDKTSKKPKLDALESAVRTLCGKLNSNSLVILRSTVPLGTSRRIANELRQQLKKKCKSSFLSRKNYSRSSSRRNRAFTSDYWRN